MPDQSDDPIVFKFFNEIGIINQLSTTMFERVMPHGLTLAQFSVLNHLSKRSEPQAPAKMASAFQVSKGTMTSTLGRLESKGFIAISPNPEDGRGKFVVLTEDGRQAREDAVAALGPDMAWFSDQVEGKQLSSQIDHLVAIRKLLDARRD